MADALKDVSRKNRQTVEIRRVAVKHFLTTEALFSRYLIIILSKPSLKVGAALSSTYNSVVALIYLIFSNVFESLRFQSRKSRPSVRLAALQEKDF